MAYLWQSEINSRINEWLIPQTWVMSPEDSTNMKEPSVDKRRGEGRHCYDIKILNAFRMNKFTSKHLNVMEFVPIRDQKV